MKRVTLQDPQNEISQYRRRVIVIGIVITLLLLGLVARLIYLQIQQHVYYLTLSRQNLLSVAPIDPSRGLIYDRQGILLAGNMPVFSLEVYPEKVQHLQTSIHELEKVIHLTEADLQAFQKQLGQNRRFNSVPLKVKLTEEEIAKFSVNRYQFPGFFIRAHLVRYYPFGALMTPILGYVGRINSAELGKVDATNYSVSNYIGKTGIEKFYETILHGTVGVQQIEMSAQGYVVRSNQNRPAIAGKNLYLTIDSQLQLAAQQVLQGYAGAVIAIDPRNGEVLALVSNPSFDPNQFVTGISNDAYQALQKDPQRPLFNRALQGEFPPGSTIKPFYALEGLEQGIISPNTTVYDPGFFKLPNSSHIYHDWMRSGHGTVNVEKAIYVSCDTFFFHLASMLGISHLEDILKQFGFGEITNLDTYSERPGLLPTPVWKQRVHHQVWFPGDTVISGIGQGYLLVTPLQLSNAIMRIAEKGQGYQMHLLLKSEAPDGSLMPMTPVPLTPINISAGAWEVVLRALREVVTSPFGTGYRAGLNAPYTFAGKSGTAQVFSLKGGQRDKADLLPQKLRDHSWFMTFAPAEKPTIAMVVFMEHGGEGGAVLLTRKILDRYFSMHKAPDDKRAPSLSSPQQQSSGLN